MRGPTAQEIRLSLPLSRVGELSRLLQDRAQGTEPPREPSSRASGVGLSVRSRTTATNAALAALLGLSRGECVPSLTRRFGARLESDAKVRRQLKSLEQELGGSDHPK